MILGLERSIKVLIPAQRLTWIPALIVCSEFLKDFNGAAIKVLTLLITVKTWLQSER